MDGVIEAHLHAMADARQRGALRSVAGRQYPVPLGEFMRWQAERMAKMAKVRRTIGAKFHWRKVFRNG